MSHGILHDLLDSVIKKFTGSGKPVSEGKLSNLLGVAARKFNVPGIAVGILLEGKEVYASYGVTNIDNPLPVTESTLFNIASVTKTFTATTIMRLVAEGKIDLHAPVKTYIPELQIQDEEAADKITILNLLNHTSGLDWRLAVDTGEGDDALEKFVAKMVDLKQITPPGTRASYSQAGYDLLGRVIEKATGKTYEQAVSSLILEPLGLTNSFFAWDDIETKPFAVGHNADENGQLAVARLWKYSRSENPGGGLASSATELIHWARFHLGIAANVTQVLPTNLVQEMQQPTVELRGSSLGDAIGIGWFLREIDGVKTVGHGGSGNGQFTELLLVPERNFAVAALSNAGPNGIQFNQAVLQWALQNCLGLVERAPKPIPFDAARAHEIVGTYENKIQVITIDNHKKQLTIAAGIKPEVRAASDKELPADYPPAEMGLLPGEKDEYVVLRGGMKGQRGFFTRDERSAIIGLDIAGRFYARMQH